jgi:hypothetical protein
MYTTIRHEQRHARKAWPGTLVDPRLLSERECISGDSESVDLWQRGCNVACTGTVLHCLYISNLSYNKIRSTNTT